ncbi:MAG TPA: sensor domain-containing diguanylate cyclase [Gemmatimonadaceae bacterium]|jgi:diguanylate cyclase (GGDEF)-like protein/PAS domain S-box-containing protein
MNLWPAQIPLAAHAWLPVAIAASVPLALLALIPVFRRRARAIATVMAFRTVAMLGVGFAILVAVTAFSIVHTGLTELRRRHDAEIRTLAQNLGSVPPSFLPVEAQLRSTLFAAKAEKVSFVVTGDAKACAKLCVVGGIDPVLSPGEVKRRVAANWPTASGQVYAVSVGGHPFLLVAEPILDGATTRALVVAGIDANYLIEQATTTAWLLLAIGYSVVILVGLSSWRYLNTSVGARLHAITKQVKKGTVEDEEPTESLRLHADELRELADSVSHYIRTTLAAQKSSDERYRRLVELAPDGIIMCTKANIKFANSAAIELAGVKSRYDIIGAPISQFLEFEIRNAEQKVGVPRAARWKQKDGTVLQVQVAEIADARDGSAQYLVRDITEIKKREAALAHRAEHDWLTGLVNRARFEARLEEMLGPDAAAARLGAERQVAILFIDLDGFKPINDRYGHAAGDAVLVGVAERLKDSTRGSDLVARLGGDEFAILLEVRDHEEVTRVAERILSSLECPIVHEGQDLKIGASIGVADTHVGGDAVSSTAAELLHAADIAMYAVKQKSKAGRAA